MKMLNINAFSPRPLIKFKRKAKKTLIIPQK